MVSFQHSHVRRLNGETFRDLLPRLAQADLWIREKNGKGNDFLGWVDLPEDYDRAEFDRIKAAAEKIRGDSDVLLVIGIGGSYLGARAVIEFLNGAYYNQKKKDTPDVYFIGNSFDGEELRTVLDLCEGKDVSVNVISKSGTTTESAIGFRIVREFMAKKYPPEEMNRRIYATTDRSRGALKTLANENGYETFVIPDDVGGRFSVLTAVGLLPIACAGIDIDALMRGAREERKKLFAQGLGNDAYRYALVRNHYLSLGFKAEVLASYDPSFRFMGEWFKQLFGESEGKDGKGLFPASVVYSSDLHSLGQFMQDGSPILFETVCALSGKPERDLAVPFEESNTDGLNYLAERPMAEVNRLAMLGTLLAHEQGGTDTLLVKYGEKNAETLGELIYFFELACAASGYILGVNPFDQPGVEAYKKNMFALLGKPGYEQEKERLEPQIQSII
ncbi:MAG: glucose-6-phosphate isomerase [Clostridia bacterium]|nr:glucose-6-phosphate isomerase [Clostridia bacterium]